MDEKKVMEVIYKFVENYFVSEEPKSPEMVTAIAELLKALN